METIQIELATMEAWEEFAIENREALEEQYGSLTQAQRHLLDGGLIMGGGAATLIEVCFAM